MVIHHFNRIIRNKWVWGVFAVLISVFFAFDFIFDGRGGDRGSNGAGTLDGETVSRMKFDEVRTDIFAEMRLQYGRELPIKAAQVNKMVWTRLAMLKVAEDLKMTATDDEVSAEILRNFKDEKGVFNNNFYQNVCARLNWRPERFEAFIRRKIMLSRVQSVASSTSWVSPLEASSRVRDETDKITVRVARFQHKNAASIKLDDASLKAYYEAHTNSLALPALMAVRYVKVPVKNVEIKVTDEELRAHFEDTSDRYGTNAFETVKAEVEADLRRDKMAQAVEDACAPLYQRVCPENPDAETLAVDQLAKLAKEEKLEIKTSRPFSLSDKSFVPGFMVDAASVLPECRDFVSEVSDIDPLEPSMRYHAFAGSNAVYVVGLATNLCTQPRVPTFDEVKGNTFVRDDALADLKAKDFKKAVDKVRDAVLADLKKTSKLDPKLFGDANVSTSITFVAHTMRAGAFPDASSVVPTAMRLAKGELSELVPTGLPGHGIVVYVEDRQPGDAAAIVRSQVKEDMSRRMFAESVQLWGEANMARLGVQPSDWTSMKESTDEGDADDGEGSQD